MELLKDCGSQGCSDKHCGPCQVWLDDEVGVCMKLLSRMRQDGLNNLVDDCIDLIKHSAPPSDDVAPKHDFLGKLGALSISTLPF